MVTVNPDAAAETGLTVIEGESREVAHVIQFSDAKLDQLRRLIATDCNPTEFELFVTVCKHTGLDPFARQIYPIKRGNKLTIQVGIDGFRLVAQRSGEYEGQEGPYWADAEGRWHDVWTKDEAPMAAKVGVWRKGFRRPVWGVAKFTAYSQTDRNGNLTDMWRFMGDNQIAKCAEAQALRKAFPMELSNVYTDEEMEQAGTPDNLDKQTGELTRAAPKQQAKAKAAAAPAAPKVRRPEPKDKEALDAIHGKWSREDWQDAFSTIKDSRIDLALIQQWFKEVGYLHPADGNEVRLAAELWLLDHEGEPPAGWAAAVMEHFYKPAEGEGVEAPIEGEATELPADAPAEAAPAEPKEPDRFGNDPDDLPFE
jgi:phage recombination protein Bet